MAKQLRELHLYLNLTRKTWTSSASTTPMVSGRQCSRWTSKTARPTATRARSWTRTTARTPRFLHLGSFQISSSWCPRPHLLWNSIAPRRLHRRLTASSSRKPYSSHSSWRWRSIISSAERRPATSSQMSNLRRFNGTVRTRGTKGSESQPCSDIIGKNNKKAKKWYLSELQEYCEGEVGLYNL